MKKSIGKTLSILPVLILCLLMMPVTALAASSTQDGLTLELTTDKSEYTGGEAVKVTAKVTNTNDFDVSNVNLEVQLPDGLTFSSGEKNLTIASLAAGETCTLSLVAAAEKTGSPQAAASSPQAAGSSPKTGDSSNIWPWVLAGLIAAGGLAALAVSKRKVLLKYFLKLLCAVLILSIAALSISTYAAANTKNFAVSQTTIVDGVSRTITAKVTYDLDNGNMAEPVTYKFNAPDPITVNGVTATVTFDKASPLAAGETVMAAVTLSGAAEKSGEFIIDLTSAKVGLLSNSRTQKAAFGEKLDDTYKFTFSMPEQDVDDFILTFGFAEDTPWENPYKLVWEDDFDGNELNMTDWNYEYHEPGWVNNELQKYVDSSDNIFVKDGNLVIKAIKTEDENGTSYTSGRINTKNKHDYKYGRFEVRAQVPSGKGFLPAFWMMPTDENLYGQWPKCGEIDIMEVLGDETNKAHGTLHFGEPHTQSQGSYTLNDGDFASEFHVYACEWEPDEIRFYVDGHLYYTENDWFTKKPGYGEVTYPAPYDQQFYMILNLAVGGNWPGNPDATTRFDENAELRVDYVKVFQKESYDENVSKPVKELEFREPDASGNYIINGDFSVEEPLDDNENWKLLLAGGGIATAEILENALHIKTTNAGNLDYSVQVVEAGLPMIQGYRYRLSFDAYASEPRTMITAVTAPDKGYKRYLADTSLTLTTENKRYSYEFDIVDSSDTNGRVEFNLGNQNSIAEVVISNVRLERIGSAETPQEVKGVLPDGNYVYNGEFQQGIDRLDYWVIDNQCDGAQVVVTNINNIRELKVTVPNHTAGLDQVIVKQTPIAITSGKRYVLSFDAYADDKKTIQTLVAGQTYESVLTTKKTTYKYTFDTGEGINGTELQFLLGAAGTIYIDNVRIQEDALLINGDFSNGMTGYEVYAYTLSDVSYVVDSLNENNAFCIDISNTGDAEWKIQLKQNNIKMENGKWYEISLDAKSTLDRKMMYALQRDGSVDDDWTPYSGTQKIELTSDYQTYKTTFQMTSATDPAAIFSISMGAVDGIQIMAKHTVVIDNIKLKEVDAPEQEENPAGTELVKNKDFANGGADWTTAVTPPGEATIDFSDGKAVCHIDNAGEQDWHVQLKQSGLYLEQGASYEVKFKVKSTETRTIKFALLNQSYDWYGGADINLEKDIEKEVIETITVGQDKVSDSAIDFVISMGKISDVDTPLSTVEISDISILKK